MAQEHLSRLRSFKYWYEKGKAGVSDEMADALSLLRDFEYARRLLNKAAPLCDETCRQEVDAFLIATAPLT